MAAACRLRHAIVLSKLYSKSINYNAKLRFLDPRPRLTSVWTKNVRLSSSQAAVEDKPDPAYHNIVTNTEKPTGQSSKHEFQSETRMLLDIVAKSLYSDKEVFIRELISNASDALEKLRYLRLNKNLSSEEGGDRGLEIHIATDKDNRTLTIQDTGIGMTHDELISNLGTIARSGSKAFLEKIKENELSDDSTKIIGQFGVGFYSAFMVADKVEVFTKSYEINSSGYQWVSDGSGNYEISPADGVKPGTKIIMYLRRDCAEFSDETMVNNIVKKYSNFVGSPIFVNGKRINNIQPLWTLDAKDITAEQHAEFYRYISNAYDSPKFILHYTADVPLSIRALLYFPDEKPGLFEMSRETSAGVSLYSKKVLIKSKADNLLPKWLRFVKGVVDSEDIPLNLSRELLQNSALIGKLRSVLTARVLKFLNERSLKQVEEYNEFYKDYGLFLKEGILMSHDQSEKEAIAKLLRFESSAKPGELVSLPEYCKRLSAEQQNIYYLAAPNRTLAEQSPYYESFKKRNCEVLFCYEPYDELVLSHLPQFQSKFLMSVEAEMRKDTESATVDTFDSMDKDKVEKLISYIKSVLSKEAAEVKVTNRLESHPCVITVRDMAAARHFIRTQSHQLNDQNRYTVLQPCLEINPKHPIIKKLTGLAETEPKLAELLTQQLFTSAMVGAGLVEDPRILVTSMNELLTMTLEKY